MGISEDDENILEGKEMKKSLHRQTNSFTLHPHAVVEGSTGGEKKQRKAKNGVGLVLNIEYK